MITKPIYLIVKLVFLQLYPAYMCFKAIKVQDANQFSPLIIYWMVTSTYLVIEYIADIFLFWFPFYYELKLVLILWLLLPQTNGTMLFYSQYMEPFLKTNEPLIDQTVVDIQQNVKNQVSSMGQKAVHFARTFISDSLFKPSEATVVEESTVLTDKTKADQRDSWSPYGIFAALMAATSEYQLTHGSSSRKDTSAALETTTTSSSSPTPPTIDQEGDTTMERADSYDSLTSIVFNGRKGDPTDTTPPPASSSTWSGYVSSWIWKPETSSLDRKQA